MNQLNLWQGKYSEFENLSSLRKAMRDSGATRLYFKLLSANDNSKNQVYLGGNFGVLNLIPFGEITVDTGGKDTKRHRFKAGLQWNWIHRSGEVIPARSAQLILYPKYPEVRLSGFLKGVKKAPSELMTVRQSGRGLFIGVTRENEIIAHVCSHENPMINEVEYAATETTSVLQELPLQHSESLASKLELLDNLKRIHMKGWIDSVRLSNTGKFVECRASNCGGYTLEAMLGISPNGIAEPDFMGWEIKQHGVRDLSRPDSGSAITLMTPEPTGGVYKVKGVEEFVRGYGYADTKGRPDRLNFGGIYKIGTETSITSIRSVLKGYDPKSGKIDDVEGGFQLISRSGDVVAEWSFASLLELWKRKHAKAAFVPSVRDRNGPKYKYGRLVELGEGTNFGRFMGAMFKGDVYLDPAIKVENASTYKPRIKRRNQFRVKPSKLASLYDNFYTVDLLD